MTQPHQKNMSAVTLLDVAKRAGVSKATVSTVINGAKSNTKVSDGTRKRIQIAAAEMQYQPNAIARSLTRRHTNIIGFYGAYGRGGEWNPFYDVITNGLQTGCAEFRKDLLLHGAFRGGSVQDIYAELSNGKIDGLVLHTPGNDPLAQRLAESHLPVVAIADPAFSLPAVTVDDVQGSQMIAAHLAERGHRQIWYRQGGHHTISTQRRLTAFLEAAYSFGMTVSVETSGAKDQLSDREQQMLDGALPFQPTAAVCWEDRSAYYLLLECRRRAIEVPEQLAVVGFNGIPLPVVPWRELTTVRAPWAEVARIAISLLIAQIAGQPVPLETIVPSELILGDTT